MPHPLLRAYAVLAWMLVICAGLSAPPATASHNVAHDESRLLAAKLQYLTVPSSETFAAVAGPEFAGQWQRNERPTLNIGYQPNGAWVRFPVINPSAERLRRMLLVDWGFGRIEARVLHLASGQWSVSALTGDEIPPSQRAVVSPIQALPLTFSPGTSEVYLRLNAYQPMVLPMRLLDPTQLALEERDSNLRMGAFFGAMLVMVLYSLSLYIFTRDRSYLIYCGYLMGGAFYVSAVFGYGPYFLWWDQSWLVVRASVLSVSIGFLSAALFERELLNLKAEGGWLLGLVHLVIGYWILAVLVSLVAPQAIGYLHVEHSGSLTCAAGLAIAMESWRRGNSLAPYFLFAWVGLMATTLGITLSMGGILAMTNEIRTAQLIGFILEFLLLSIALADRINRERASRMQAQRALLAMRDETNLQLEARVATRTQQLEQANLELKRQSHTDALTGLSNRRGFDERFAAALERARAEAAPLAFLMLDIDHFKRINDRFGHSYSDECLAQVGRTLSSFSRRDNEFAARLGGEEFAAVFIGMLPAQALAIAEQIRETVAGLEVSTADERLRFTISIGVAVWVPDALDDKLSFSKAADEALYKAKAMGRNRVCSAPIEPVTV